MFIEFSHDLPGQNVKLFFFYNDWYGTFWLYKAIVELICIVKFI